MVQLDRRHVHGWDPAATAAALTDVPVYPELRAPPRFRQQEVLLVTEQQEPTQNFLPAALER